MKLTKEHIQNYEKQLEQLEKKFNMRPSVSIEFPQYKRLPVEVQLALQVLEKHEYKLMLSYMEVKNGHEK